MATDPRIQKLLEEVLESGASPEALTSDCPDLLPQLLSELRHFRSIEAAVTAMFPESKESLDSMGKPISVSSELPEIPGYEIESVLGRGGMGVVYRGRHLKLNRPVAIKMLLAGTYATSIERERFQREAEAAARLQHPNMVQVHDVGDHNGRLYFTMEFISGGSLADQLAGVPLAPHKAAEMLATLADAIHKAHECRIVHRDLKPSNILMTSEGVPKINDFGLARPMEDAPSLTITGSPLGTPSYMSPEQARGDRSAVGPGVDIYALGAVLYELLTGRPPFRAESSSATLQQVICQEPVAPSHLNANVPRDLETICLKCLQKDPERRYASAVELRDDLRRFIKHEPIVARPIGLPTRLLRWTRRNPAGAALIASSVLFSSIVFAVLLLNIVQQSKLRNAIESDLRQISEAQGQGRWGDALASLQRAEARLGQSDATDLNRRLNQIRKDLDLVKKLDRIHLNRATGAGDLSHYRTKADQQYLSAFEQAGLATKEEASDIIASRVKNSAIRLAIVSALDDWAVCASDRSRRLWILRIARAADSDPMGWGDKIRDDSNWSNRESLSILAATVPVKGQSVSLLLTLGERLRDANVVPTEFLRRVQNEHPADFWANIALGDAVLWASPVEAAGYYRAALASRPDAAVAYTALGDSLRVQKRYDEARGYYLQALQFDPDYARGHSSLGNLLKDSRHFEEAIASYRRALQLDPNYVYAHLDLANVLREAGRYDESLEHYRQVHAVNQSIPYVENAIRSDLVRQGRGEEVLREWKKKLELDPPQHTRWFGYAELCLFLENKEEYRIACRELIRRFADTNDPYIAEPTARAILLAPSDEDLKAAIALADRAVAAEPTKVGWVYAYFLFAKGLAEYRRGNYEGAITLMTGRAAKVLGPCPGLVTSMAKFRIGDHQDARSALAHEVCSYDWSMSQVRGHDQWLWHVLRREAENLIFPNSTAFLDGKYEPRDNTERLALLGVTRFKNRSTTLARLYADAFAADSSLVDDPRFSHRYNAARAAAMAGCGQGEDVANIDPAERSRLRLKAKEWLRADLTEWGKRLDRDYNSAREGIRRRLTPWRTDPELAGLRESTELEKLPADEQKDCRELWKKVDDLLNRCARQ